MVEDVHDKRVESGHCPGNAARFPELLIREQFVQLGDKASARLLIFGTQSAAHPASRLAGGAIEQDRMPEDDRPTFSALGLTQCCLVNAFCHTVP